MCHLLLNIYLLRYHFNVRLVRIHQGISLCPLGFLKVLYLICFQFNSKVDFYYCSRNFFLIIKLKILLIHTLYKLSKRKYSLYFFFIKSFPALYLPLTSMRNMVLLSLTAAVAGSNYL